jgi:hypothetical protein
MNQDKQDMLYDLLVKKAVYGLDDEEQRRLDELDSGSANREFKSLEITAAAINMAGLTDEEPLPEHLYSKIAADAPKWVGAEEPASQTADEPWPPVRTGREMFADAEPPRRSIFGWLGWAAAAAACIALAANIWMTRFQPNEQVKVQPTPAASPRPSTPDEMLAQFESTTPDLVRANWAPGNVKEMRDVTGEVVWSDEKQAGYLRIRGLAVRTAPEYCYQLWIFDKVQDKATPIDGGIFDVNSEGEIIIPITTKIPAQGPTMFALTIERHGGVVVSKRDKIAAIAKVENRTTS